MPSVDLGYHGSRPVEPQTRLQPRGRPMPFAELKQIGTTIRLRRGEVQYEILVYPDPEGFHAVWRCECRMAGRSDGTSPTTEMAIDGARIKLHSHHQRMHAENHEGG